MIKLKNITFGYNINPETRANILDGLDFEFNKGDRIGLLGPNGCGKTTLLHIIIGLLSPHSGEIEAFGKQLTKEEDFLEVRQRVGFLFQDSNDQLFCPTVAEDIAFGPLNLGKTIHEAQHIVQDTLELVGMSGFEDRVTYKLSGGEKRLVALATILAMKPEAVLLDEPATGLDEATTERIKKILNESDLSIIAISHNREFLEKTTKKLLTIRNGKIAEI